MALPSRLSAPQITLMHGSSRAQRNVATLQIHSIHCHFISSPLALARSLTLMMIDGHRVHAKLPVASAYMKRPDLSACTVTAAAAMF
eukprot:SAG31_NODE_1268_length_9068_cov_6.241164_2_plen_87_part_00